MGRNIRAGSERQSYMPEIYTMLNRRSSEPSARNDESMSIQFGRYNFDGKPVDLNYLQEVARVIAPYGPDGGTTLSRNSMAMLLPLLPHDQGIPKRTAAPRMLDGVCAYLGWTIG